MPNLANYKDFLVPAGLQDKVLTRLTIAKTLRREKRQLVLMSLVLLLLSVVSVFTWQSFYNQANSSGFVQYLSLVYYDYDAVALYWRDLGLSLLESMPVIEVIQLTVLLALVMYNLKAIYKYSKDLFINYRLITNR